MKLEVSRRRQILVGITALLILSLIVTGAVASYTGAFVPTTRVYLYSDRAGLQIDAGADVKLNGVVIGRVAAVEVDTERARLTLDIDRDKSGTIPSNVDAEIVPTTLFGRKFVSLQWPETPGEGSLAAGSVIDNRKVSVEINDILSALLNVLESIDPEKVNATLTALSTALQGHGRRAGELLVSVDHYLSRFNDSLPTLQRDIPLLADNLDTLAAAAPDLMASIANLTTTAETIVDKQADLSAFLLSFTRLGNSGEAFSDAIGTPLIRASEALAPTARLLAEYSPVYPCFLANLNQSRKYLERAFGSDRPGLNILATLLLGSPPYTYPEDRPVIGANEPPSCYGSAPGRHEDFDVGTTVYGPVRTPLDILGNPFAPLIYGLTR
ncbi:MULTISPECIES: MCE family protein [Nocardia]|uniref:MCE family protein n=1 Tax=Nocardia TaxID=1817 RepID=UPI0007EAAA27|nr:MULTISPECIES: MCE family protein [Nocardia]MBF6278421.1 MCE family protein [Nocardia nova]OBA50505.1 hypothetical protein A5789_29055 [Nocardia sp. 852002-51101_SCH5132738]OBB45399.1 hypothetical protein A5748_26025 [Nocardia sp. 852002-51244_SCH5132740]OBF69661.1 hypothetical protein A9X06_32325 [Mycobacterium sp. 852002-51759_SCH5129042]